MVHNWRLNFLISPTASCKGKHEHSVASCRNCCACGSVESGKGWQCFRLCGAGSPAMSAYMRGECLARGEVANALQGASSLRLRAIPWESVGWCFLLKRGVQGGYLWMFPSSAALRLGFSRPWADWNLFNSAEVLLAKQEHFVWCRSPSFSLFPLAFLIDSLLLALACSEISGTARFWFLSFSISPFSSLLPPSFFTGARGMVSACFPHHMTRKGRDVPRLEDLPGLGALSGGDWLWWKSLRCPTDSPMWLTQEIRGSIHFHYVLTHYPCLETSLLPPRLCRHPGFHLGILPDLKHGPEMDTGVEEVLVPCLSLYW